MLLLLVSGVLLLVCFEFVGVTSFSRFLRCHHCFFNEALLKQIKRFLFQHGYAQMHHKRRRRLGDGTKRAACPAPVGNELDSPFACNLASDCVVKTMATIGVTTVNAPHDPLIVSTETAFSRGWCWRGRCCVSCLRNCCLGNCWGSWYCMNA